MFVRDYFSMLILLLACWYRLLYYTEGQTGIKSKEAAAVNNKEYEKFKNIVSHQTLII